MTLPVLPPPQRADSMSLAITPNHRTGIRSGRRAATPAEIQLAANEAGAEPRPDMVSALDRGLTLLNCFRDGQVALGASELSRLTDIPRPTVIRLAATLVAHRWLQPDADGERFRLGAGVVSLARSFLAGLDIRAAARAQMQALADATGGAVYLAVRDGLEMVLIEACRASATMLSARLDVGSRVPMAVSALGRAYLGAIDEGGLNALLAALQQAAGDAWPAQREALERALAAQAGRGFALSAGEFHAEINSVSAAITAPTGQVYAFNCGGPAFSFSEVRLCRDVAPALLAMAARVARDVGA
jgi:DNA-binding IclR family transcriptional regulator